MSFGHQRLKIIDLSERASQPMLDSSKKIWLVFNGEIYNFKEIRKELENDGYKFNSKSDTEIIIFSYQKWGYDCVKHFNGMWVFALYDKSKNKLFLSRDRLGKKPLYYYNKDEIFIFSSGIKPLFLHNIEKELNGTAVSSFLSYRYVLGEETMFKNIFKLLPAYNLVFDVSKKKIEKIWEYWDIDKEDISLTEEEAEIKTKNILKDAISLRQISDVPIGSINSGGLDSSFISSIMALMHDYPIKTFTAKFPEKDCDETGFAKILSEHYKTDHKEILINTENFIQIMEQYVKKKDEPIGVPNEIALYKLFQEIKKDVTVILSGEGADELFAGYSKLFRSPFDYERLKKLGKKNVDRYKKQYPSLYKKYNGRFFKNELEHFMFLYDYFPEKNIFLKKEYRTDYTPLFKTYFESMQGSYMKKISYVLLKIHLPCLLERLDNSSMANAVEARCPFIDYRLINFVFNLPFSLKNPWISRKHKKEAQYKNCDEIAENYDIPKYLLKKIAENYVPRAIINRIKKGFPLPLQKWFKKDFFKQAMHLLFSKKSQIKKVVNQDSLRKWVNRGIRSKDSQFGQKLWMLVSLELWLREWF